MSAKDRDHGDAADAESQENDGAPGGAGRIHGLLERLTAIYAVEPFRAEAVAAREEYFTRSGKVFEDDGSLWERRIAAFQEWYLIERPLTAPGGPTAPPVLRAFTGADGLTFGAAERRVLAALATSQRSLFDITARGEHEILVEDLIGGARFSVRERRSTIGFDVGDTVEARLVGDGQAVVFARTFLFHPRDARAQVLDIVDGCLAKGESKSEVLFRLARLHLRWHRLGHASAARVYREGLLR